MSSSHTTEFARRDFLRFALLSLGMPFAFQQVPCTAAERSGTFNGLETFNRILTKATTNNWKMLAIGELMGKIAKELEGTPYVAGTLENSIDTEVCSVDLTGLDCVTFFETTLCFARMLKKGGSTPADLLREVSFTRYRGGKIGDYSSRLHYTTDWFYDNQKKGVVEFQIGLPGTEPFSQKVGFMSSHPDSYKQLAAHPELIEKMKKCEEALNNRAGTFSTIPYIPQANLPKVEPHLKTGDIVGVCTNIPGLDIAHTGLVFRDAEGIPHFMDASSNKKRMKVTIEPGPISQALHWSKTLTGAIFARPLEPK